MFTRAHHWSLPCARLIQSTPSDTLRYIWILSARILRVIVKLMLCTPWRRIVGSGTVAPHILNQVISWRIVAASGPVRLTLMERVPDTNWVFGWVSPRPGQSARRREKPLWLAGNRTTDRAARRPGKIPNESSRIVRIAWTVLVRWRGGSGVPH